MTDSQALVGLNKISRFAVWIFGSALIVVAFVVSAEVVLRQIFEIGSTFGVEYSSYVLAVSSAFAFSFTLLKRGHVRVDFIKLMSPRIEIYADILALVAILVLACFLTYFAYSVVAESFGLGAVSSSSLETPLYVPQLLWFAGLLFFAVTAAALLVIAANRILRGDAPAACALISAPSISDEIEELVHDRDGDNPR